MGEGGMDSGPMKPKEVGRPIYDRNTLMRDLFQVLADPKFKTVADLPADSDWRNVGGFEKLMELVQKIDEEDHRWFKVWREEAASPSGAESKFTNEPIHDDVVSVKPVSPMFKESKKPPGEILGGDEPVSLLSFTTESGTKVLPIQTSKSSEQNK